MSSADMTPDEQRADTLPPDLCCRCPDVAPFCQWVDPKPWTDSEGRACEQRTCASCGCSVSRLVTS